MTTAAPATIDISPLIGGNLKVSVEVPDGLQILEGERPAGYHQFSIMHPDKGDERLVWDASDFRGIKAAKEMFMSLVQKGLKPMRVGTDGTPTAEFMDEFDPLAEEVVFLPNQRILAGG